MHSLSGDSIRFTVWNRIVTIRVRLYGSWHLEAKHGRFDMVQALAFITVANAILAFVIAFCYLVVGEFRWCVFYTIAGIMLIGAHIAVTTEGTK